MSLLSPFPYRRLAADALQAGLQRLAPIIPELTNLTFIEADTLRAWREQWRPHLSTEFQHWDWEIELQSRKWTRFTTARRRFDVAIWSGDRLCGLALGRLSLRKQNLSICLLQGCPIDWHPLKGKILPIVADVGSMYGTAVGCEEFRFLQPLPGMIRIYGKLGFQLARTSRGVQYCALPLGGGG